jgi:hypothetical protein
VKPLPTTADRPVPVPGADPDPNDKRPKNLLSE